MYHNGFSADSCFLSLCFISLLFGFSVEMEISCSSDSVFGGDRDFDASIFWVDVDSKIDQHRKENDGSFGFQKCSRWLELRLAKNFCIQ